MQSANWDLTFTTHAIHSGLRARLAVQTSSRGVCAGRRKTGRAARWWHLGDWCGFGQHRTSKATWLALWVGEQSTELLGERLRAGPCIGLAFCATRCEAKGSWPVAGLVGAFLGRGAEVLKWTIPHTELWIGPWCGEPYLAKPLVAWKAAVETTEGVDFKGGFAGPSHPPGRSGGVNSDVTWSLRSWVVLPFESPGLAKSRGQRGCTDMRVSAPSLQPPAFCTDELASGNTSQSLIRKWVSGPGHRPTFCWLRVWSPKLAHVFDSAALRPAQQRCCSDLGDHLLEGVGAHRTTP